MISSPQGGSPAASWPQVADPYRRPLAAQRADVMGLSADASTQLSAGWQQIAAWFEDTASAYDATLELLARSPGASPEVQDALEVALAAFDRAGDVAHRNSLVWDDVATEVTLAQARMSVIWVEYQDELRTRGVAGGQLSERYSSRSAREVWLPVQAEMHAAGERIQDIGPFPEDRLRLLLNAPSRPVR